MQMCPNCDKVYDESEYARCPYCRPDYYDRRKRTTITYSIDDEHTKRVPTSKIEKNNRNL